MSGVIHSQPKPRTAKRGSNMVPNPMAKERVASSSATEMTIIDKKLHVGDGDEGDSESDDNCDSTATVVLPRPTECFVCGNSNDISILTLEQERAQCQLYKGLLLGPLLALELEEEEHVVCATCLQDIKQVWALKQSIETVATKGRELIRLKLVKKEANADTEEPNDAAKEVQAHVAVKEGTEAQRQNVSKNSGAYDSIDLDFGVAIKEEHEQDGDEHVVLVNGFLDSDTVQNGESLPVGWEEAESWKIDELNAHSMSRDPLASDRGQHGGEDNESNIQLVNNSIPASNLPPQLKDFVMDRKFLILRSCEKCKLKIFVHDDYKRRDPLPHTQNTSQVPTTDPPPQVALSPQQENDSTSSSSSYVPSSTSTSSSDGSLFSLPPPPPKKRTNLPKKPLGLSKKPVTKLSKPLLIPSPWQIIFPQRQSSDSSEVEEVMLPLCPACRVPFPSKDLLDMHLQQKHPTRWELMQESDSDDDEDEDDIVIRQAPQKQNPLKKPKLNFK